MRVLLDESLPRQLALELSDFNVRTVSQQNWIGLSNGELLRKAEAAGFDVFVTADQNLQFQQNLSKSNLGLLVIVARSNRIQELRPLVPEMKENIKTVKKGELRLVVG